MDEFLGQENVTILEFINPSNFHFLSIQLDHANVVGEGDWIGGDTWFDGNFSVDNRKKLSQRIHVSLK